MFVVLICSNRKPTFTQFSSHLLRVNFPSDSACSAIFPVASNWDFLSPAFGADFFNVICWGVHLAKVLVITGRQNSNFQ